MSRRVSIPGGLISPIVCNAEAKSLSEISNEIKELSQRAKQVAGIARRL